MSKTTVLLHNLKEEAPQCHCILQDQALHSGLPGNPSAKGNLAGFCLLRRWCQALQNLLASAEAPEATEGLSSRPGS